MDAACKLSEPPQLRTLRRVIPVVQTQERAGWAITCIAAEAYDEGFRITLRVYGEGKAPNADLALRVRDDRENDYHLWTGGGSGEPTTGACDWRLSFECALRLDPTSRELSISVDEVSSSEYDLQLHRLVTKQVDRGPWTFLAPLPRQSIDESPLPS